MEARLKAWQRELEEKARVQTGHRAEGLAELAEDLESMLKAGAPMLTLEELVDWFRDYSIYTYNLFTQTSEMKEAAGLASCYASYDD